MRHPFTPASALALALKLSAGSLALAAFAPAMAEPLNHYNIQAGPLAEVLSRYARESGVSISFETRQLASQNSNGLTGDYGVDEGFAALLRGHGLQAAAAAATRFVESAAHATWQGGGEARFGLWLEPQLHMLAHIATPSSFESGFMP